MIMTKYEYISYDDLEAIKVKNKRLGGALSTMYSYLI
jgi:hypothetical protein